MNKSGLVDAASARTGLGRRQVEEVLESVLETMAASLGRGEAVNLLGYIRLDPGTGHGPSVRVRLGPRMVKPPGTS